MFSRKPTNQKERNAGNDIENAAVRFSVIEEINIPSPDSAKESKSKPIKPLR